jgi:flavin reductase (DIM6/NTAB) family NADH-FMN oxidoreductase RutF
LPLVAVSNSPRRHSRSLIEEKKRFVVNIPTIDMLEQTEFCGAAGGREHDKFKETGLTQETAEKVKMPLIKNA